MPGTAPSALLHTASCTTQDCWSVLLCKFLHVVEWSHLHVSLNTVMSEDSGTGPHTAHLKAKKATSVSGGIRFEGSHAILKTWNTRRRTEVACAWAIIGNRTATWKSVEAPMRNNPMSRCFETEENVKLVIVELSYVLLVRTCTVFHMDKSCMCSTCLSEPLNQGKSKLLHVC
jgi:hypothetical protein